jgi:hypothetical protein
MFPATLFPNDRYPVIATKTYMKQADPILAPITPVVLNLLSAFLFVVNRNINPYRRGELSLISFKIENIYRY